MTFPFLPRVGLCQAVQYILRLKPYAMCVGGPPCSSFVWMNVATSKRSKTRPFGNTALGYIQSSNKFLGLWSISFTGFSFFWGSGGLLTLLLWGLYGTLQVLLVDVCHILPRLTARWALLLILCLIRQVLTLTEQPNSSLMPWFPYIRYVARVCKLLKKLGFGLGWLETFLHPSCTPVSQPK